MVEDFYAQQSKYEHYNQEQHEESEYIIDSLHNFYHHFMKRLPVSCQPEHSQKSKTSENSDVIFLAVLNFVNLVLLKDKFNYRDYNDSSIKLVEAIHSISLYTQSEDLDGHLGNEDPGTVVVDGF